MRYIKNIIISAFVLSLSLVSCTGQFEDINTNPNKNTVGSVKPYNLFEPIFYATGKSIVSVAYTYAGPISGQFADTGHYTATAYIHQWNLSESNFQSIWDSPARYGYDCQHMIDVSKKYGDTYYEALGYVFKVFHLANLASLFGEIPYTEAYKGPTEGIKTPRFESQSDVFNHMCNELDYATSLLKENPLPSRGGLDKLYKDNCKSWIKFANTLKIRILNRISNADPTAWSKIQYMLDNPEEYPVFTSIADQAVIPFTGSDPYQSYFYTGNVKSDSFTSYKLSEQLVNMMYKDGYTDPRLYAFAQRDAGEKWVGTIPGTSDSEMKDANSKATAHLNDAVLNRNNAPSRLLEYSELLFIIAEGVQRGKLNMPNSAKYYYEEAVRASVNTWADYISYSQEPMVIDDNAISALLRSSIASFDEVSKSGSKSPYSTELELILSQKWISLFWIGFEPYHEWRRSEYPIITIQSGTAVNDYEMPTRMQYPMSIRTSNSDNMHVALQRMGGENTMHTPLWWSYKALNNGSRPEHVYSR